MSLFLDLRNSNKPPFYKKGDIEILPIKPSEHTLDAYDIIDDLLPSEFVKRMKQATVNYPDFPKMSKEYRQKSLAMPVCVPYRQIKANRCRVIDQNGNEVDLC